MKTSGCVGGRPAPGATTGGSQPPVSQPAHLGADSDSDRAKPTTRRAMITAAARATSVTTMSWATVVILSWHAGRAEALVQHERSQVREP